MTAPQPTCAACQHPLAPGAAFCGACGRPDGEAMVGRVLDGRYRLLALVGTGGMGRVYRAEHAALERAVAVKVLHPEVGRDQELLERFRREAIATSRLAHPNVVGALDFGVTGGLAYFVMEWLGGVALDELVATTGPLAPARALNLALQIAAGLGAAHAQKIVHRDVKPGNVLVGAGDQVKLVDFGLAQLRDRGGRLTQHGFAMGTPAYLAPEQVTGEPVGPACDVYGLGGVLYEMLTGAPAVGHGEPLALVHRQLHGEVTPPSQRRPALAIEGLDALVLRLLAKQPEQRPADGAAAHREIAAVLERLTTPTVTTPLATHERAVLVVSSTDTTGDAEVTRAAIGADVATAGGTVSRAVGDELFAHFASAEVAALTAVELVEARPALRAAVHFGEVQLGSGGGLFGDVVNQALRLARLTDAGDVVVSDAAAAAAGLAVATLLVPHGKLQLGTAAVPLWLAASRADGPARHQIMGLAIDGELAFTCSCGSPGRVRTDGARGCAVRCAGCSQPLMVHPTPTPTTTGGHGAAARARTLDAIVDDDGARRSPDHNLLAALADLE